ncbi:MAG: transposase, partial [Phycisphaerae bacterium]
MRILTTGKLFDWESLDDSADLKTLRLFLEWLPDSKILAALRLRRYKGRNDYPVQTLWRVHWIRYALRHITMEHCLAELRRNPALREVALIPSVQGVPKPWNMSRFEEVLGEPESLALIRGMFEELIGKLGSVVPDLGRHLAGDSSCLSARADSREASLKDERLPQPSGGRKEYRDDRDVVTQVYEWFGYKFHLLVDVKHEVIISWDITSATQADVGQIPELVRQAKAHLPEGRIETLAYDKAADSADLHLHLAQEGIKPGNRSRPFRPVRPTVGLTIDKVYLPPEKKRINFH